MPVASPFMRIFVVAGYVLALVSLLLLSYFGGPALSVMLPDYAVVAGQTARVGGPLGQGDDCRDQYEPDDEPAEAAEIYPDMPQQRLICPEGDEDWIMLQGVSGKVYTIDVTEMSQGLDLSLTLYNEQQEQLAFNDDFPHDDDPHDIRPRIQSWQVPADGQYFIRVRDNVGRGGLGLSYTIVVQSESYGLRPTNIPELCLDRFEPDDSPELAQMIMIREVQEDRTFCPDEDQDWVRFFARAGQRYRISVDSNSSPGVDPTIVIMDRDGASVLARSEEGAAASLPSAEFEPAVDGFYYAQLTNAGGIGGHFIQYDLIFDVADDEPDEDDAEPITPTPNFYPTPEPFPTPDTTPTPQDEVPTPDTTPTPQDEVPTPEPEFFPTPEPTDPAYPGPDFQDFPTPEPTDPAYPGPDFQDFPTPSPDESYPGPSGGVENSMDVLAQAAGASGVNGHSLQYDLVFDAADGDPDDDAHELITPMPTPEPSPTPDTISIADTTPMPALTPDIMPTPTPTPEPFPTPDTISMAEPTPDIMPTPTPTPEPFPTPDAISMAEPTPTPDVLPTPDTTPTPQDEVPTPEPEFFPTPEPTDPAYPGPDFEEFPTPSPDESYPGSGSDVQDSMGVLAQVTNAGASLRSGEVEIITEQHDGVRSVATVHFDLGDDLRLPRLRHVTTTGGMLSAEEYIVIGDQAWQCQAENWWTSVFDQPSVSEQVQALLPDLSSAWEPYIETLADGNLIALLYYDAQRDADVTVVIDANSGVLLELQRLSRRDGSAITVRYHSWNTFVDIIPPVDS